MTSQVPGSGPPLPLVSVVTPTLNRAHYLEQTLRSVAGQTYPRIEHIVVDGGSTDGTLELLRRWQGRYDLRWVSARDDGMYEAINHRLKMARGGIVAYLNSDDLYFPWTIQTVVRRFGQRPAADFVFGDVLSWDTQAGSTVVGWQLPFSLDYIRRCGMLAQPGVFWKRRVMDDGEQFDETLRLVADCDYWMRMGARHRFAKVDEFLAVERNHASTLRLLRHDELLAEIELVRTRYVRTSGARHKIALGWHRLRFASFRRYYWIRFILAAKLTRSESSARWAGLLGSDWFTVSTSKAVVALVPRLARRAATDVVRPRPEWFRALSGEGEYGLAEHEVVIAVDPRR